MSAKLLPAELLRNTLAAGRAAGWAALAGPSDNPPRRAAEASRGEPAGAATPFQKELATVQAELEQVRKQAEAGAGASYRTGFDEGLRQGLAQHQAEIDSFRNQIASTLRSAEIARRELLEQADADLAKLSIAIAERILNRQVQVDPGALEGVVRSALGRLAGKPVQCVHIHPEDRPAVEKALASMGGKRAIRVEADASLARGSLLFDTDYGTLDGSIRTQLDEIESGLVDRLRRGAP